MSVFLDTSVLLAGLVDFGPQSGPAQSVLLEVSEGRVEEVGTAWHCCLEFYSVSTRLPREYRLDPVDAVRLLREEILSKLVVHDLPPAMRAELLDACVHDTIAGGRIYDAHIADVARAAGSSVIVTDNRRHFLVAMRHGLRVQTPTEFLAGIRKRR